MLLFTEGRIPLNTFNIGERQDLDEHDRSFVATPLFYGLGVMFAGLAVFIPIVILISVMPALAPFILIGLVVWWFVRRKRKARERELPTLKI